MLMTPNNFIPKLYQSGYKLLSQRQWRSLPVHLLLFFVVIGYLWGTRTSDAASFVQSTPTTLIPYQGRVLDSSEQPLTGNHSLQVALYNTVTDGSPLWSEVQTNVAFQQGLFHLLLGSSTPIPQEVITQNSLLYLGITIGDDSEMTPRVQLGSVPYAIQAQTVPDGAVTSEKIADGAITADKLAPGLQGGLPPGTIVMWSGALSAIPEGWALCDGTQGTPDLRNRFVVGAGAVYASGDVGGFDQVTLTVAQIPAHTHGYSDKFTDGNREDNGSHAWDATNDKNPRYVTENKTTGETGGNQPFDNRPPYYALIFIMKL